MSLAALAMLGTLLGIPAAVSGVRIGSSALAPNDAGVESFEVIGVDGERVSFIASQAAELRRRISAEVLGVAVPAVWTPRCVIHVHPTADAFAEAVGGTAGTVPASVRGATSIEFIGEGIGMRRIDLIDDESSGLVPDALGHELVHVILADRFIDRPPPRWADEGLAMLFDTEEKQRGHDEDFREAAIRGMAWSGREMFEIDLDPADIARQRVFYGESLALVRWFLAQGDAETFLSFIVDCDDVGLSSALKRHYGILSLSEFDGRWNPVQTAAR